MNSITLNSVEIRQNSPWNSLFRWNKVKNKLIIIIITNIMKWIQFDFSAKIGCGHGTWFVVYTLSDLCRIYLAAGSVQKRLFFFCFFFFFWWNICERCPGMIGFRGLDVSAATTDATARTQIRIFRKLVSNRLIGI